MASVCLTIPDKEKVRMIAFPVDLLVKPHSMRKDTNRRREFSTNDARISQYS